MDVSMPITTVVPSLDGPVFAALAATATPMGLADVYARVGRGSKSGIRSVLLRMVDEGLVLEVPGGYVLNGTTSRRQRWSSSPPFTASWPAASGVRSRVGPSLRRWSACRFGRPT